MGHRAAARSLLAIAATGPRYASKLERRRTRTKGPVFMSWLEQSEKCLDKYALAWPVDYESAQPEASSRKQIIRSMGLDMGPENSKSRNRLGPGRIVSRRSRRCPKHVQGSDLANMLMNTGAQSQVSGLATY